MTYIRSDPSKVFDEMMTSMNPLTVLTDPECYDELIESPRTTICLAKAHKTDYRRSRAY